jgi:hypothetical protein
MSTSVSFVVSGFSRALAGLRKVRLKADTTCVFPYGLTRLGAGRPEGARSRQAPRLIAGDNPVSRLDEICTSGAAALPTILVAAPATT